MRIAIIGSGALGSLFAALFARGGADVWIAARNPLAAKKINEEGVRLWEGDTLSAFPVRAISPPFGPCGRNKFDLVIIAVKAGDTREAAKAAKGLLGPDSSVLTLQNGIGPADILCEELGAERVLVGVTAQGATLISPGEVRHGGSGETVIGPASPKGSVGVRFTEVFTAASIPVRFTPRMMDHVWKKLCANCGINALTGILGVKNGRIPEIPEAAELSAAAVREAVAVAVSRGIELPGEEEMADWVLSVAKATGENRSSMLQDLDRGNPTEIDFINGAVARLGKESGVPCPVNLSLALLVKALESERRSQPCQG